METEIKRLEAHMVAMEHKYKMSTEEMAKAARADHALDTAEVGLWLVKYQTLKMYREIVAQHERGRTSGIPSRTT